MCHAQSRDQATFMRRAELSVSRRAQAGTFAFLAQNLPALALLAVTSALGSCGASTTGGNGPVLSLLELRVGETGHAEVRYGSRYARPVESAPIGQAYWPAVEAEQLVVILREPKVSEDTVFVLDTRGELMAVHFDEGETLAIDDNGLLLDLGNRAGQRILIRPLRAQDEDVAFAPTPDPASDYRRALREPSVADGSSSAPGRATPTPLPAPSWPVDGFDLVFVLNRFDRTEIIASRADGSALRNLSEGPMRAMTGGFRRHFRPRLSADGRWLVFHAYESMRDEIRENAELFRIELSTGRLARVTDAPDSHERFADISPDSREIVFSSDMDGDFDLYTMPIDGGEPALLLGGAGDDSVPAWSPDGRRIAFISRGRDRGDDDEIYVLERDGTGLRQLTDNEYLDEFPAWSPDGSQLAFTSARTGTRQIWIMDADGGNERALTTRGGGDPAWSPDGSQLAFFSDREGSRDLYLIDLGENAEEGTISLPRRVTTFPAHAWNPEWRR